MTHPTIIWTGWGHRSNLHDPLNWEPERLPGPKDHVFIPAGSIMPGGELNVASISVEEGKQHCPAKTVWGGPTPAWPPTMIGHISNRTRIGE